MSAQAVASARETSLGAEVYRGLSTAPRSLSPWLFYDERGSELFERITLLPEYYLTRTERALFASHAGQIVAAASGGQALTLVELGAGTALKTGLLLQAAAAAQGTVDYHAIDVAASALEEARRYLEARISGVRVHTRTADYTEGLGPLSPGRKLVLYIGSSLGNFEPAAAAALLASVRRQLAPGDRLLLGVDHVKAPELLLAAYDDAEGVTAEFNRNVLRRIDAELGADFALDQWAHEARWNEAASRIEMHLRSTVAQTVRIPVLELRLNFSAGETIHTENSYKFTGAGVAALLAGAGFAPGPVWTDEQGWFGVYLAEAV